MHKTKPENQNNGSAIGVQADITRAGTLCTRPSLRRDSQEGSERAEKDHAVLKLGVTSREALLPARSGAT